MAIDWKISRRRRFAGSAAALAGSYLGFGRGTAGTSGRPTNVSLMSAARIGGVDGGALVSRQTVAPFSLPARAHALARLPDLPVAAWRGLTL